MKIQCHRPSLTTAFQIVSGVVPSRTTRDILKNVKLTAQGGTATLTGTDSEVGIRYEMPGIEILAEGETLLPTQRLVSILRELQDETVTIELSDESLVVQGGNSIFKLAAEDPAEFPQVAQFSDDRYFAVPGKALKQMIQRTIFATDVESTRYALGGVLWEPGPETITLAATDSRRLAVVQSACRSEGAELPENTQPVVPAKAVSLIERSIADNDADVLIALHPNEVLVKSGNATIYSRLVEGRFPRYRDVIPNSAAVVVDMLVGPLYSAVRQAQIVTNEESRGVDFTFSSGQLTLTSQAADIGQSRVSVPISYDADELIITFDPRFVADFLRVLDPETSVHLSLIDAEHAAVLRTDDEYTYVIMPLSRDRR